VISRNVMSCTLAAAAIAAAVVHSSAVGSSAVFYAPCFDHADSFAILKPRQQLVWSVIHSGHVSLASQPSLCLTAPGDANSTQGPVTMQPCAGVATQNWTVVPKDLKNRTGLVPGGRGDQVGREQLFAFPPTSMALLVHQH
jgi:hypothetical protein